jgi:hypothetical protein
MEKELYINNKDAYLEWGVNMGEGFINSLCAPASLKEHISNESRLEDGKRVIVSNRLESREFILPFTITGLDPEEYKTKKDRFLSELYEGNLEVQVPSLGDEVYHLIYLGKSVSFSQNVERTFCKLSVKVEEPNPANRK